jgi:predicted dinucleotide-binding enzyme
MRIGIIGAGNIGTALVRRLSLHGHELMLSYSRDPAKLARTAEGLGVRHGSPAQVVGFADVIALTVPWAAVPDALAQSGDLEGKMLWDCTNPLLPDLSGLAIGTTTSGGEEVARLAPGAKVIKGIPPMAELLHADDPMVNGRPVGLFVAGNNTEAKVTVSELLSSLPGDVTDAGDLTAARLIEPAMLLLVRLAYGLGHGPRVGLRFEQDGRA